MIPKPPRSPRQARPFRIVPWDDDFLLRIHSLADSMTGGQPGKAVIVFPLNRPRRYLLDLYRQTVQKPMLLPHIINAGQLTQLCLESWTRTVPRMAGTLDQAALMKESVLAVARGEAPDSPLALLAKQLEGEDGMARFFPWGVRLARLLDECAGHLVDARDLAHAGDLVADYAAALLGSLGRIQKDYRARLLGAGLGTPGIDAQRAALLTEASPDLPLKLQGRSVIIAGFVRLTASQDRLFRYLYDRGAEICLHTDPALVSGGGHWSCGDHREWMKRWKAKGELYGETGERKPALHFFAGYDLHSQLLELERGLKEGPAEGEKRAVVLSHDAILMPTLHHIPEKDINISLGYPLSRSLLAQLVERILKTRESMDRTGRVHWKALLGLVRHPYVRMLCASGDEGEPRPLRPFLTELEARLRNGTRMVDAADTATELVNEILDPEKPGRKEDFGEPDGQLLEKVADVLVTRWKGADTLERTADCLRALCQLLLEHGRHIWPDFPLDTECLVRLMQNVIPELADNAMGRERLSPSSLVAIVRQSMKEQRVPFEADPLTGLQILGMLETRLLRFDRVHLLDLTEEALPGAPSRDPLLPDSLRTLLGLPDNDRRDMLAAHTFHRLIAGAKEVFLYWQEGVQSGVMDGKKERSRFVEEAIWHEEQRLGRRLHPGEWPLEAAAFPMSDPPSGEPRAILRTPEMDQSMDDLLRFPISPTMLDIYLACPARFYRRYLCGLHEQREVIEADDVLGVGDLVHKVLETACRPFLRRPMPAGSLDGEQLEAMFRERLEQSTLLHNLPAQSLFMLEAAVPQRLGDYAAGHPDVEELLHLEDDVSATLRMGERSFLLKGTIDRLDRREEGLVVLDYKTGSSAKQPHPSFWHDQTLWESMEDWVPGSRDPLPDLADSLPSVQLPCYLFLCGNDAKMAGYLRLSPLADAALVMLGGKGEEVPLFGPDMPEEVKAEIMEKRIPALLRFLLRHMATSMEFTPRPSRRCQNCPYRHSC